MNMEIRSSFSKSELEKLNAALEVLAESRKDMMGTFNQLEKVIRTTKVTIQDLEQQKSELEQVSKNQEKKISGLNEDQFKLLQEYEQVKEELEKITKLAGGIETKNFNISDMKNTLKLYNVLANKILNFTPHFRILNILHGDAEEMDLETIKESTGINGATVLHACHDLARAKLIEFNVDSKHVQLINRIFPKKEE
ncbi:MAG: hypothetical protein ACTSVU_10170 [Promethearchaeota archaeon]